jgi:hypothetical protein
MDIKKKRRNFRIEFLCIGTLIPLSGLFFISLQSHDGWDALVYAFVLFLAAVFAVPYIIISLCIGGIIARLVYPDIKPSNKPETLQG